MEVEYSKYKKLTNLLRYYELGYQDTGRHSSEDFRGISSAYVCLTFNNNCISHLWLLAGGGCTFYIHSVFISCVMFFFVAIANFSFQNSRSGLGPGGRCQTEYRGKNATCVPRQPPCRPKGYDAKCHEHLPNEHRSSSRSLDRGDPRHQNIPLFH